MTDRDLLERAAKAAGIALERSKRGLLLLQSLSKDKRMGCIWNPLTDDGDAFRLAASLGLVVDFSRPSAGEPFKQHAIWLDETMSNAELARRAIVRAAAAMAGDAP